MQRKFKIDWEKPDDVILERYREVFPEKSEENLRENIKYQKLIFAKTSSSKRKKGEQDWPLIKVLCEEGIVFILI